MRNKLNKAFWILVLVFSFNLNVKGQVVDSLESAVDRLGHYLLYRAHDSTYISNFGNELALKFVSMNKYNFFSLIDSKNQSRIKYRPARDLYLGVGFAYKWIAADFTLGLGLYKEKEFEEQQAFDFQGRIFSSKHYFAATLQYYRGYKMNALQGTLANVSDTNQIRKDVRNVNMELQYLYALNYTKFSLKAPFVLNEIQKKSAGSTIFGGSYSYFSLQSDSSLIPIEAKSDFIPEANLTNLSVLRLGINFGYMYTLVIKKNFFITASVIPGVHFNTGDYSSPNINQIAPNINLSLISMNSLGYNGRRFFGGLNFSYNGSLLKVQQNLFTQIGYGKLSAFVGYRFKNKKDK